MPQPLAPITGPAAWRGHELASHEWIVHLGQAEVDELGCAVTRACDDGLAPIDVSPETFVIPTLRRRLEGLRQELLHGRGFVLIRGLPIEDLDPVAVATLVLGIGVQLGTLVPQNAEGHVLGHVRDVGLDHDDPHVRIYQTRARQSYHTDSADLVGLLCVQPAKRGGLSSLASAAAAYNELLAREPDLVTALFDPIETDRRGEIAPGQLPYFKIPVLSWYEGRLLAQYQRQYIESARRFAGVPPLTTRQVAALDALDTVLADRGLHLDMELAQGDLQLIHNHQLFHDRTAFEDWPEASRKRHLLRLWVCPPDGWPLPPCFADRFGSITIGNRGGIRIPGVAPTAPVGVQSAGR